MKTRHWFRNSEVLVPGPRDAFVLVGILASSWEEATEIALSNATAREALCLPCGFLSCNAVQLQAIADDSDAAVIVRPSAPPSKGLRSARRTTTTRKAA